MTISDSTLTNNKSGGAIGVQLGNVTISESTLTNNSAQLGEAINIMLTQVVYLSLTTH